MQFRGDSHFVWCSPAFEGAALGRYAIGAGQPASSDPATIYRQLHLAVSSKDEHDAKIADQAKRLRGLAIGWHKDGEISDDQRADILAIIKSARISDWRPVIYVIPYAGVAERVQLVARKNRASHEPEYFIPDLRSSEFDLIEPVPCS
jgi:hypothetical protein